LQTLQPWFIEPVTEAHQGFPIVGRHGRSGPSKVIKPNGMVSDYQKGDISGQITGEDGTPLPGVNILVKGTTNGTITDIDGRFTIHIDQPNSKLVCSYIGFEGLETEANSPLINFILAEDIQELQEIVVIGYGTVSGGSINETPSAVNPLPEKFIIKDHEDMDENFEELEVSIPYTIPSDGKEYTALLTDIELGSDYIYKSVPKLNRNVFLQARISGYGKYFFRPGNAGLFYQGTYLGNLNMSFSKYEDTLDISFGNEEKIIVKREKLSDENRSKALSASRTIEKSFKITIKNTKNETVKIQLQDQYPVATKDYIQSEPILGKTAVYDEKTGIITWNLELKPYEEKEVKFGYQIKFPKSKKIIQE